MDDLRSYAETGLAERRREVTAVRAIVEEEVERFLERSSARGVAPLIAALREKVEDLRQAELDRFAGQLDDQQRQALDAATRAAVAKLLHEPTVAIKDAAGTPRGERLADALRELFDL
jgi:glutamyl-tRNA reductase